MFDGIGADVAQQIAGVADQGAFGSDVGCEHHEQHRDELQAGEADREYGAKRGLHGADFIAWLGQGMNGSPFWS